MNRTLIKVIGGLVVGTCAGYAALEIMDNQVCECNASKFKKAILWIGTTAIASCVSLKAAEVVEETFDSIYHIKDNTTIEFVENSQEKSSV
jgi:ABC-type antimicrobial peptide transport system permease subunit